MRIIIFFIFVSFIECAYDLKYTDLCYPKQGTKFSCFGNYNFSCGGFICTRTQYNCHVLSLFSGLNGVGQKRNYETFMNKIKYCPEPAIYKLNKNAVCLKPKSCEQGKSMYTKRSIHRLWSIQMRIDECKCSGKFSFKCISNYCGLDKRACEGLKKKPKYELIKKCF